MTNLKICTKCGDEKRINEFGKTKKNKSGVSPQCSYCVRTYHSEYLKNKRSKDISKENDINIWSEKRIIKQIENEAKGVCTTMIKIGKDSFTIESYNIIDCENSKWIPISRVSKITELDVDCITQRIGSHCVKDVLFKGSIIKCVDSISLLKLNRYLKNPEFTDAIINFSTVKNDIKFDMLEVINSLKTIDNMIKGNKSFGENVNIQNKIELDLLHVYENEDMVDEDYISNGKDLKKCRIKRRNNKIKKIISDDLRNEFKNSNIIGLIDKLQNDYICTKLKLYRSRVDGKITKVS